MCFAWFSHFRWPSSVYPSRYNKGQWLCASLDSHTSVDHYVRVYPSRYEGQWLYVLRLTLTLPLTITCGSFTKLWTMTICPPFDSHTSVDHNLRILHDTSSINKNNSQWNWTVYSLLYYCTILKVILYNLLRTPFVGTGQNCSPISWLVVGRFLLVLLFFFSLLFLRPFNIPAIPMHFKYWRVTVLL